jgi:hypothetical protein
MIPKRCLAALAASALAAITTGQVTIVCVGSTQLGDNCGPIGPGPGGLGAGGGATSNLWAWPLCVWQERTLPCQIGSSGGWWDAYFDNGGQTVVLDESCCPAGEERYLFDVFTNGNYDGSTYDCDSVC